MLVSTQAYYTAHTQHPSTHTPHTPHTHHTHTPHTHHTHTPHSHTTLTHHTHTAHSHSTLTQHTLTQHTQSKHSHSRSHSATPPQRALMGTPMLSTSLESLGDAVTVAPPGTWSAPWAHVCPVHSSPLPSPPLCSTCRHGSVVVNATGCPSNCTNGDGDIIPEGSYWQLNNDPCTTW